MAHLLIIELPGGNDFDLVQAALDRGDRFTFLTSDLTHYMNQGAAWTRLVQAQHLLEIPDFAFDPVTQAVLKVHAHMPIEPEFALARCNAELKQAVEQLGLPLLIKPSDGYASQNIAVLRYPEDLDPLWSPLEDMLPSRTD